LATSLAACSQSWGKFWDIAPATFAVVSTTPTANSTAVAPGVAIQISFSSPPDATSFTASNATVQCGSRNFTLTFSASGNVITINHRIPFGIQTTCTATLKTTLRGQNGASLASDYTLSFQIDGRPSWYGMMGTVANEDTGEIIQTQDGGFVFVGLISDNLPALQGKSNIGLPWQGLSDCILIKFDHNAQVQWYTTFGSGASDRLYGIVEASDGSLFGVGQAGAALAISGSPPVRQGPSTFSEGFAIKFSSSGAAQWVTYVGSTATADVLAKIAIQNDGTIVAGGSLGAATYPLAPAQYNHQGGDEPMFIQLSPDGVALRIGYLGSVASTEQVAGIRATADGGFIACGYVGGTPPHLGAALAGYPAFNGAADSTVWKFDANGTLQWWFIMGLGGNQECKGVAVANDGSYFLSGYTSGTYGTLVGKPELWGAGSGFDAYIMKLASNGYVEWHARAGSTGGDYSNFVSATADGGAVFAGQIAGAIGTLNGKAPVAGYGYSGSGTDAAVWRVDASGNLLHWGHYGNSAAASEGFGPVIETSEGGYLAAGSTPANIGTLGSQTPFTGLSYSALGDIFIAKIKPDGSL